MTTLHRRLGLLAVPLLLVGCASGHSATSNASSAASSGNPTSAGRAASSGKSVSGTSMAPAQTRAAAASMSPGMTMPDGSVMSGSPTAVSPSQAVPTATAKMVCGDDIRGKVVQVLKLTKRPVTTTTWADQLYTCTYALPVGPMVLSVKQSRTNADAKAYFTALRSKLGPTESLDGLGEGAYRTTTGIAVVVKDNMTLKVDTTRLPAVFGPEDQKRTDLANEIASDVLGCWTGDE